MNTFGYIYKLTNKLNGKSYIGRTIQPINIRWKDYKNIKCKSQPKLYRALKKYGVDLFDFEVIDESAQNIQELKNLENKYTHLYDTVNNGYNCNYGGDGIGILGEGTKQKMASSHKGKMHSEETKKKMSMSHVGSKNYMFGRTHSEKVRQKIKDSHKDIFTEEMRNKMSVAIKAAFAKSTKKWGRPKIKKID